MIVIGLTGSIGMGKSTTAAMFAQAGVPVYDADAEVAAVYAPGGAAVEAVEKAFPGVVWNGAVDRNLLTARVLHDPKALERLTKDIVYPLLADRRAAFFKQAEKLGVEMVVLDIPLLLETGGELAVDAVVVVSAPEDVQRERVLARPGMTPEKFEAILAKQMPDQAKRALAHFVIDTGRGLEAAREQVEEVIAVMRDPKRRPATPRPVEDRREPGH